jgi:hypothetical protein
MPIEYSKVVNDPESVYKPTSGSLGAEEDGVVED